MGTGHVAVVGAGLAGLSAAVELKRAGYGVELFERTRLLGGKATSFSVGGVEVDNGQHVYLGCCTEFIDFVEQVWQDGPSSTNWPLWLQPRFDALLLAPGEPSARLREANLPSPLHFAPALIGYRHLSPRGRLMVALALLAARRPARPGETFGTWLRRHRQSDEALRAFWEPFIVPALNAPLDEVAALDALFVVTTAFLGRRGAARFGFSRVPLARIAEAAADRLDGVHLRASVAGLDLTEGPNGTLACRGLLLSDGSTVAANAVVLAVPPAALNRLLGESARFGLSELDQFKTAPIVDVHLWYEGNPHPLAPAVGEGVRGSRKRAHAMRPYNGIRRGALHAPADQGEGGLAFAALLGSPIQWVFEKGPGYLCCSLSAADEQVLRPEPELVELCHRELSAVLPGLRKATLTRGAATRDREATFIPAPGLRRPGPATSCPDVVIAGAWTDTGWPATMESAVRSGRAAARLLAARSPAMTSRPEMPERGATAVG